MLRYAVLIAVACLFFDNISKVQSEYDGKTVLYGVKSKMKWRFSHSESDVVTFDLRGDWYVQRSTEKAYSFYSGFGNISLILDRKSSKNYNLERCESFRKVKEALQLPCLVYYGDDQTFKGIKYNKDDLPVSRHLKYTYASFLQVNTTMLKLYQNESKSFVHTTEAIGELGTNCTTNYEIEPKRISENITNFFLNKFIYSDTCTKDKNPDDYILKKICNTQKNNKFTIEGYNHINFELGENAHYANNVTLVDYRTFEPWKGSSEKLLVDLRTGLFYKVQLKHYKLPRIPEINPESELEIYMSFTHPDESVIHGRTLPDLRKLYKAFSCDASVETTERELVGEFIKCGKELK